MSNVKACLVCKKSSSETPVTKFYYQESEFYICPQHIPVLIHNPQELVGLLDGADKLQIGKGSRFGMPVSIATAKNTIIG